MGITAALILSKFVIVAVFGLGAAAVNAGLEVDDDPVALIPGAAMLLMAAFAPVVLFKFVDGVTDGLDVAAALNSVGRDRTSPVAAPSLSRVGRGAGKVYSRIMNDRVAADRGGRGGAPATGPEGGGIGGDADPTEDGRVRSAGAAAGAAAVAVAGKKLATSGRDVGRAVGEQLDERAVPDRATGSDGPRGRNGDQAPKQPSATGGPSAAGAASGRGGGGRDGARSALVTAGPTADGQSARVDADTRVLDGEEPAGAGVPAPDGGRDRPAAMREGAAGPGPAPSTPARPLADVAAGTGSVGAAVPESAPPPAGVSGGGGAGPVAPSPPAAPPLPGGGAGGPTAAPGRREDGSRPVDAEETRVVYGQPDSEVASTRSLLGLSDTEAGLLPRLSKAVALWKVGQRSFLVQHRLGRREWALVDTDAMMVGAGRPAAGVA